METETASRVLRRRIDGPAVAPCGVHTLPRMLLDIVVSFAVRELEADVTPIRRGPLVTLASVCRAWRVVFEEIASQRELSTAIQQDKETPKTRSGVLRLRRKLTLRGTHARSLILRDVKDYGVDGEQFWRTALSHTPRLQSLSIIMNGRDQPSRKSILPIITATGSQCPALERLSLPRYRPLTKDKRVLMETLVQAMTHWRARGGLRQLKLGWNEFIRDQRSANEYLTGIITHCPRIETIDGFQLREADETVKERWLVDLKTWRRFCQTCDQLTQLDWASVAFATAFFEIFSQFSKPRLQSLTLTTSEYWPWEKYLKQVDDVTRSTLRAQGYGGTARRVDSVLLACPDLRCLIVQWHESLPELMDPEIFDDGFFEVLAGNCKELQLLRVVPVTASSVPAHERSLATQTDRTLVSLAQLPCLSYLDIVGGNFTGDGLFDFIMNHSPATRDEYEYIFSLGDTSNATTAEAFYSVLQLFLERLDAHEGDLPCASRRMSLHLINRNDRLRADVELSPEYFAHVRDLAKRVKAKYPSIVISGLASGYRSRFDSVRHIYEFIFVTEHAEEPDWRHDDFLSSEETPIDGIFVHRVGLHSFPYQYRPSDSEGASDEEEDVNLASDINSDAAERGEETEEDHEEEQDEDDAVDRGVDQPNA